MGSSLLNRRYRRRRQSMLHTITECRAEGNYTLWLRFDDGLEGSVNLGDLVLTESVSGDLRRGDLLARRDRPDIERGDMGRGHQARSGDVVPGPGKQDPRGPSLRSPIRRAGQPTGGSNGEIEKAGRKEKGGEEEADNPAQRDAQLGAAQTGGPQARRAGPGPGSPAPSRDTRRLAVPDGEQALANPDATRRFASGHWNGRFGSQFNSRFPRLQKYRDSSARPSRAFDLAQQLPKSASVELTVRRGVCPGPLDRRSA